MARYVIEIDTDTPEGTVYLSSITRSWKGAQTWPILKSISSFTRAIHYDFSIENSTVTISMHNVPRFIDRKLLSGNVDIVESPVRIYDGDDLIFSGWVKKTPRGKRGELDIIADIFTCFSRPVAPLLKKEIFSTIPDENAGKTGTVFWGTANADAEKKGKMKAYRIGTGKFHASWKTVSSLLAVYDKDGNDISADTTLLIKDSGRSVLLYDSDDLYIRFNALGPEDTGTLIENPADMFQEVISAYGAGFPIDTTAARQVFINRAYHTGNVIGFDHSSPHSWVEFFRYFSESFGCHIIPRRDGTITLKMMEWQYETPSLKIHPSRLKEYTPFRNEEKVVGAVCRKNNFLFSEAKYLRTPQDVPGCSNRTSVKTLNQKYAVEDSVSLDVARRLAKVLGKPLLEYSFYVPRSIARQIDLGDVVELKNPISRPNVYQGYRLALITREIRNPSTGFVGFEGLDVHDMEDNLDPIN